MHQLMTHFLLGDGTAKALDDVNATDENGDLFKKS